MKIRQHICTRFILHKRCPRVISLNVIGISFIILWHVFILTCLTFSTNGMKEDIKDVYYSILHGFSGNRRWSPCPSLIMKQIIIERGDHYEEAFLQLGQHMPNGP